MQKTFIAKLIGLAFAVSFAVPEGGVGAPTDHKPFDLDLKKVRSWAEEGEKAGNRVREVQDEAESFVVQMLLATAEVIAGTPSQEDWLTGYAKAWKNPDTAKSRKGDARAVFEAFALKGADGKLLEIERIVGYGKKQVDGAEVVDVDSPIKETKVAKDWLKQYQGDFKGFLALARSLRGKKSAGGAGGTGRTRTQMTDNQHKETLDLITVANTPQAEQIITKATGRIAQAQGFERLLVNELQMIVNVLKQRTNDQAYLKFASDLTDQINDFVSKREAAIAQEMAKSGEGKAEGHEVAAPKPAVQKAA